MPAPASRLLVRLPNWLGDIVMALPALGRVRAGHHGALAVAVPAALAPLASAIGGIDEVVPLQAGGRIRGAAADADAARLRDGRFDRALLLTNSFSTAWMLRRAGIPARAGYAGQWRRMLLTEPVSRAAARAADPEPSRHHARYYTRLVGALGFAAEARPARVLVTTATRGRRRPWRGLRARQAIPAGSRGRRPRASPGSASRARGPRGGARRSRGGGCGRIGDCRACAARGRCPRQPGWPDRPGRADGPHRACARRVVERFRGDARGIGARHACRRAVWADRRACNRPAGTPHADDRRRVLPPLPPP